MKSLEKSNTSGKKSKLDLVLQNNEQSQLSTQHLGLKYYVLDCHKLLVSDGQGISHKVVSVGVMKKQGLVEGTPSDARSLRLPSRPETAIKRSLNVFFGSKHILQTTLMEDEKIKRLEHKVLNTFAV